MLRFFVSLFSAKKDVFAALFLILVAACLFWPLLFDNQILFFGDISLYFTPLLHFQQGELVGQGRIPLWNPRVLCGTPFVGNPQAWPLYPSSLLLYRFSAETVTGVTGAFHLFWASLGTFAFLRVCGRSRTASLLGAISWGFGGALVSKMQFPNMVQAASWLPWLLLACEGVLHRASALRAALLGLVVGLALLAAHPQMFLLQFYLAAAWVLWRTGGLKQERRKTLSFLAAGFLLGAGIAAAQLLPTLELVRHSVRPDLPLEKANRFILPPYAVLTNFLAPNFYGNPAVPGIAYVGRGNFWESCSYIGILPILLFVYGAVIRFREGETRFWLCAGLAGVWLAVGKDAWLFGAAFHVLPGINRFHDAARFLFPATFALACLAAAGVDCLSAGRLSWQKRWLAGILVLLTAVDVVSFSRTLNPTIGVSEFRNAIAFFRRDAPPNGRIFQTDEGKIWGAFVSYRTYETLSTPEDRQSFLQSLAPNLSVLAGDRDASGYEPVRLASIDRLLSPLKKAAQQGALDPRDPVLDVLAIERLAYWQRVPMAARMVPRATDSRASRAALWLHWRTVENDSRAFEVLLSPQWDGLPLVAGSTKTGEVGPGSAFTPLHLKIVDSSPGRTDILLPSSHGPGLVALADTNYPGWSVTVDGHPSEPISVNGAFRGVLVDEETSVVRWTFDPGTWRLGMFISLLTVGIMAVVAVPAAWSRVRRSGLTSRNRTI